MVSKRDQDEKEGEEKEAEGRTKTTGLGRGKEFRSSSATIRATISARKALRHYILGVRN